MVPLLRKGKIISLGRAWSKDESKANLNDALIHPGWVYNRLLYGSQSNCWITRPRRAHHCWRGQTVVNGATDGNVEALYQGGQGGQGGQQIAIVTLPYIAEILLVKTLDYEVDEYPNQTKARGLQPFQMPWAWIYFGQLHWATPYQATNAAARIMLLWFSTKCGTAAFWTSRSARKRKGEGF